MPRVDFTSTNFASTLAVVAGDENGTAGKDWNASYNYDGYLDSVKSIVKATCIFGSRQPFAVPASNSTWSIDFHGPSLGCSPVDAHLNQAILDNVWTEIVEGRIISFGYLSWTPDLDQLPFTLPSNLSVLSYPNSNITVINNTTGFDRIDLATGSLGPFPDEYSEIMPATLYIAIFPKLVLGTTEMTGNILDNSTIVQCELRNSSYVVSFKSINGLQEVDVLVSTTYNNVSATESFDVTNYGFSNKSLAPGASDRDSRFLVIATVMEYLAYQSVMDAFGTMFIGFGYPIDSPDTTSSVMSTVIGRRATEMQFLWQDVQLMETDNIFPGWNGTSIVEDTSNTTSLQDSLEELFKNITVNLMTSDMLQ